MAAERAALSCLGTTLSGIKGVAWGGGSAVLKDQALEEVAIDGWRQVERLEP